MISGSAPKSSGYCGFTKNWRLLEMIKISIHHSNAVTSGRRSLTNSAGKDSSRPQNTHDRKSIRFNLIIKIPDNSKIRQIESALIMVVMGDEDSNFTGSIRFADAANEVYSDVKLSLDRL